MFSSNNDFDAFVFQRLLKFRADIGIGNQFVHALEAADDIGTFTAKLLRVGHQDNFAGGIAHRFADRINLIKGGDAGD